MRFWIVISVLVLAFPALLGAQQSSGQQESPCMPNMKMLGCPESSEQQGNVFQLGSGQATSHEGAMDMQMDPYFTAINYTIPKDTVMVMLLPDFQIARSGPNFLTAMQMVEYGITSRWSAGFMSEEQKIPGLPTTFGGLRFNTYFHVLPHDHLLNFTLYGEFEDLNQAALYKMEVSGFGGEDLSGPLSLARNSPAHTFEQRAIVYHDWSRVNLTFNFINETGLETHENDFGYAWGVFRQPEWMGMRGDKNMAGMPGMAEISTPPAFSVQRLGFGLEMMGALGNNHQFGFYWQRQQQYFGPVFSYAISPQWTFHLEPTFGLSDVSDPFVLRIGLEYSMDHFLHRLAKAF